jgi:pSer/pThr/pTyr-binding forkhead associated (FHA) protein
MWILQTTERSEAGPFTFRLMPGAVKTIGRSTTADFIVDAGMVSRFHCRLTVGPDGRLEIQDLESTNGTFVNDRRVHRGVHPHVDKSQYFHYNYRNVSHLVRK